MKTRTKTIFMLLFTAALTFSACNKDDGTTDSPNNPGTPDVPVSPNNPGTPDVPVSPTITNATFTFDGQTVPLGSLTTNVKRFTTS